MFDIFDRPECTPADPYVMHAEERTGVLDREITKMTAAGYYVLTRVEHGAVLACEYSLGVISVSVDEHGELIHEWPMSGAVLRWQPLAESPGS